MPLRCQSLASTAMIGKHMLRPLRASSICTTAGLHNTQVPHHLDALMSGHGATEHGDSITAPQDAATGCKLSPIHSSSRRYDVAVWVAAHPCTLLQGLPGGWGGAQGGCLPPCQHLCPAQQPPGGS